MQHNFEKKRFTNTQGLRYDINSIMHYSNLEFSRNGLRTIEALSGQPLIDASEKRALSPGDVQALRLAYNCNH